MRFLGQIEGTGQVVVDGEEIGQVQYEIRVYEPPNALKEARGTIVGDEGIIWAVYQSRDSATLVLEDGGTVGFMVKESTGGSGVASIRVNSSVPGF